MNDEDLARIRHEKTRLTWFHKKVLGLCKYGGVPSHIAFVMDGNRRYAKSQGFKSVEQGHEKGFESLLYALEVCLELGVDVVTVYAFAESNFNRSKEEVDCLMRLATEKFGEFLKVEEIIMREGVVVDMWGRPELLPKDVRNAAARVVLGTRNNKGRGRLNVCFAYSGTEEIASALRKVSLGLLKGMLLPSDVSIDVITYCTYLGGGQPPQLLVRTSGETRLSDFLLWHLGNTRIQFLEVLWPDLGFWDMVASILDWQYHHDQDKREEEDICDERSRERISKFKDYIDNERMERWKAQLII